MSTNQGIKDYGALLERLTYHQRVAILAPCPLPELTQHPRYTLPYDSGWSMALRLTLNNGYE